MLPREPGLKAPFITGDPGRYHVQITRGLCLDNTFVPTNHQENLDEPSAVGRVHSVRESHRAGEFRCTAAVTERSAARARRQATNAEVWSS